MIVNDDNINPQKSAIAIDTHGYSTMTTGILATNEVRNDHNREVNNDHKQTEVLGNDHK